METTRGILFSTLSMELILEITSYLDPSSLLNLALTCSRFHRQTVPVLDLHRVADTKYNITSDLLPVTVTEILGNANKNGVSRWHVRELEFWGSRKLWEDWRAWELQLPETFQLAAEEPAKLSFTRKETKAYLALAKMWWELSDNDFDTVRSELESGDDGFIKMLLIASCPRLHTIKFVKRGDDTHTSLQWMTKAIGWSKASGEWPPGFQSLRNVAIGVSAGMGSDEEEVHRKAFDLAAILNLPDIETVYIQDLDQDWDEDQDVRSDDVDRAAVKYSLLPSSSSVQHIYLDRTDRIEFEFRRVLLGVSKHLQSMTVRGKDHSQLDDMDIIVSSLGKQYPETMETLTFYNPHGLHGYRCSVFRPEEFSNYRVLKQFSIALDDVELDAYYNYSGNEDFPNRDQFIDWIVEGEIFPPSMEILMFWSQWSNCDFIKVDEGADRLDILDDVLVAIINQKSELYTNLHTIYVDATEQSMDRHGRQGGQREKPCFQKAIAVGREAGVHVHTMTNRDDSGTWQNFPAAPDKFDLKTGVHGERPDTWKINRLTGDWEDPGCEGCGKCEDCLRIYPEHAWQSVATE